jgi:hypothetical protein
MDILYAIPIYGVVASRELAQGVRLMARYQVYV